MEIVTKLEIAKKIIRDNVEYARSGLFDCLSIYPDEKMKLFDKDGLTVLICHSWRYFEVFGLTNEEFENLHEYYAGLVLELEDKNEDK